MSNPTHAPDGLLVELDGGELVEAVGGAVVLTLPPSRAHDLAHAVDGRRWRLPARVLDDMAAALGDEDALTCSARLPGPVPVSRRLAAAELLGELSGVQRIAVIDAAAGWLGEDAGGELAYALLRAVCPSDTAALRAYLALLGQ